MYRSENVSKTIWFSPKCLWSLEVESMFLSPKCKFGYIKWPIIFWKLDSLEVEKWHKQWPKVLYLQVRISIFINTFINTSYTCWMIFYTPYHFLYRAGRKQLKYEEIHFSYQQLKFSFISFETIRFSSSVSYFIH